MSASTIIKEKTTISGDLVQLKEHQDIYYIYVNGGVPVCRFNKGNALSSFDLVYSQTETALDVMYELLRTQQ